MDQQPKDAEYERKLAALRAALKAGEESGPAEPFDIDAFIAEMNAEYEAHKLRPPRREPGPRSNP
jgi:Arc/MetJ-type ribon-helix-helix transcriptional regulator